MAANISRRGLFRRAGLAQQSQDTNRPAGIHPPWAAWNFAQICDGCGDCIKSCPEHLLVQNSVPAGAAITAFPRVEFGHQECTFCGDCVAACDKDALSFGESIADEMVRPDPATAFSHHMHITARCLSWRGISCRLCEENCEPRAIRFHLQPAGRAAPSLDEDQCTGCGACMTVCPEQAIVISKMATGDKMPPAFQGERR